MAERNADFIQLFGGLETTVWVGDELGLTLPEDFADLSIVTTWSPIGWLQQDAKIVFNTEKETGEIVALQAATVVKKTITKVTQRLAFAALEDSALVAELAFINPVTLVGTAPDQIAKQDITSNQNSSVIRPVVIDVASSEQGGGQERWCFSAVDLTYQGELNLADSSGEPRVYAFDGLVQGGAAGYRLTTSPGVLAGAA